MDDAVKGPAVFTPEAVERINRAYAEACDIAGAHDGAEELRSTLAERIMFLARNGETDEQRLCSLAVLAVLGRKVSVKVGDGRLARSDFRTGVVPPAGAPGSTGTGHFLKKAT